MVDLHIHTKHSDGDKSVTELLQMAERQKLEVISFTDHNRVDAYDELKTIKIKDYFSGTIITGTELNIYYKGYSIEVLGYNFNADKLKKSDRIGDSLFIKDREILIDHFFNLSKKYGFTFENSQTLYEGGYFASHKIYNELIRHEENYEILKSLGIDLKNIDTKRLYRDYISRPGNIFYKDFSLHVPSLKEGAEIVRSAGGKVLLAHPFGVYPIDNPKKIINEIIEQKLVDGLECYHDSITEEQSAYLVNLCKTHNLLMSGGSDFHTDKTKLGYVNKGKSQIPNNKVSEEILNSSIKPYKYK